MKRFFSLLLIRFKTGFWEFREFFKVAFKFWTNPPFFLQDISLLSLYLFQNPYRISKKFLLKLGAKDPYVYGETPLTTFETILRKVKTSPEDTLFELGCGRGRTCYLAASVFKCRVVGADFVKTFIDKAKKANFSSNPTFVLGNFLDLPFEEATLIYLYGSAMTDEEIYSLILALKKSQTKARIMTVSFPLDDYDASFKTLEEFEVVFPWGKTTLYVQKRI